MGKSQFVRQATRDLAKFRQKTDIDFIKYNGTVAWKLRTIKKSYENKK
jgi:hypothetical protein